MDSYIGTQFLNLNNHHHNHQEQNQNSGLLRFRSAPSSLFNELGISESMEIKPERLNNSEIGYSNSSQMVGVDRQLLPPQYPKRSHGSDCSSSLERTNSMEVNVLYKQGSCGFNLNRQNSSPAGFFDQLNSQNGYNIGGLRNFRVGNGTNGESSPRTSRLNMSHLPQIPEFGNENLKETSTEGVEFRNHENDAKFNSNPTEYAFVSWNNATSDASHLSENGEVKNRSVLSHHLSLPNTGAEIAAIDKLLNYQDVVPCKLRAKRGYATHPRSIAERMRRNRISERMRKLQELVPNMDNQTNTSDMLDLAVDYIKNLQNQYKVLSGNRAKCKCVR